MNPDHDTPEHLSLSREAVRKGLHLSVATVPVLYAGGLSRETIEALLAAAASVALTMEIARRVSPAAGSAFQRFFGSLLRNRERTGTTGATWLLVSSLAAVLVLSRSAAIATLWCVTVGDPAATLAGRAYRAWSGAHPGPAKTPAGSAACFAVSLVGSWRLAHLSLGAAAVVALAVTMAERAPVALDDNVRVAVAAAATAWLLS